MAGDEYQYDVFLSFRGLDTGMNFTDFLYKGLTDAGIRVFRDEDELPVGEGIKTGLIEAIKQSRVLIPIISRDYASSKLCLTELVQILECRKTMGRAIIPIFYEVEALDVRHQRNSIEESFLKHKKSGVDSATIQKWKLALEDIGSLKGFETAKVHNGRHSKLIDDLIAIVQRRLKESPSSIPSSKMAGDKYEYDVFLSFRGPDTGMNFTDFLYKSLIDAGIRVFRDDDELPVEEGVKTELIEAIKQSKVLIPIISRDYASSKLCLMELVQILECRKMMGRAIIPIFYEVKALDVRHRRNSIGESFLKHEKSGVDSATIQKWQLALEEIGSLMGFETAKVHKGRHSKLIDDLIPIVQQRLKESPSSIPSSKMAGDKYQYDVFLSFGGPDTGMTFTDFLYKRLIDAGIRVFRDDDELPVGEGIKTELIEAIKQSKVLIPIISRDYASSKLCLTELVQILECRKMMGRAIIPIFFEVEALDVRHQRNSIEESFLEHEKSGLDSATIQKWKLALKDIGSLKGFETAKVHKGRHSKLIDDLIPIVQRRLKELPSSIPSTKMAGDKYQYDVFLSFGGLDTGMNFTDFLYKSLIDAGIRVFRDDDELPVGEKIKTGLIEAIKQSKVLIPIISRDYASSKFCLTELVQILECWKTMGRAIIPIFFEVEPSDVRHRRNSIGESFLEHEKSGVYSATIQKWQLALEEIGSLMGFETAKVHNGRHSKLIDDLIPIVQQRLKELPSSIPSTKMAGDKYQYDVFLSFGGLDTGMNFTDFLYKSLIDAGIRVFRDDDKLPVGEGIKTGLIEVIKQSKVLIPIISRDYACSKLCLTELVQILECWKTMDRAIIPIFYEVEPSDVRHRRNSFEESFIEHEKSGVDCATIRKWQLALKEIGSLMGFETAKVHNGRHSKLIDDLIPIVQRRLKDWPSLIPSSKMAGDKYEYDVFLSFRWPDTGMNFTDFLYKSLIDAGIRVFRDDDELPVGEGIKTELIEVIKQSRVLITIISRDYACSKLCLTELVQMLECWKTMDRAIIPIFYEVEPSDVSHRRNSFEESFIEHEKSGVDCATIRKWKLALKDIGSLKGFETAKIHNGRHSKLIDDLIPIVQRRLKESPSSVPSSKMAGDKYQYDVFLRCRGLDTGMNFTDFLYKSLIDAGIWVFRDDDELPVGEGIKTGLIEAIKQSKVFILFISRAYASSKFCLTELVQILECRKTMGRAIIPIFYEVEPSDVRHQRNSIGESFLEHEKSGVDSATIQKWKLALKEIGSLKGFETAKIHNGRHSKLIDDLIPIVQRRLKASYDAVEKNAHNLVSPNELLQRQSSRSYLNFWMISQRMENYWGVDGEFYMLKKMELPCLIPSSKMAGDKYECDVFLSFRGPDTGMNFTDFLYKSLIDAGIRVFRNDDELPVGEGIKTGLIEAIKHSRVLIPIISRDYASSKLCLKALVEILECWKTMGQAIIPIFYEVEPSDVRHQRNSIEKCFLEHKRNGVDIATIQKWKQALRVITVITGFKTANPNGSHSKLIDEQLMPIVLDLLKKDPLIVTNKLVGVDHHVQEIMRKLGVVRRNGQVIRICGGDVRVLGIYGIGGVGKSTIAKVVYNQIYYHFQCYSYLKEIRESSRNDRILSLQSQLISDLRKQRVGFTCSDDAMVVLTEQFRDKQVLILLDNMEDVDLLNVVVGDLSWFGPGSRIIVTSRKSDILLEFKEAETYEVEQMEEDKALQLFSKWAFERDSPSEGFESLSRDIVSAIGRLPPALMETGSSLFGKSECIWKETLEKLKDTLHEKVEPVLKVSYDALEKNPCNLVATIEHVIGIDNQVKDVIKLLGIEDDKVEVCIVGIHGASGIGKTTLAKAVYDRLSSCFDSCSFLAEIGETTQNVGGIQLVQTKLICDILERDYDVASFKGGIKFFLDVLGNIKALIVLDDVEEQSQLNDLLGHQLEWFGSGSRIIVTTEHPEILQNYDSRAVVHCYEVNEMDNDCALELFRKHALGTHGSIPGYPEIGKRMIKATGQIPFFIEVIGSLLRGKTREEWWKLEDLIKPWKENSRKDSWEILKICYDSLDEMQKQIFWDIAWFANGMDSRIASYMWLDRDVLPSYHVLMPLVKIGEDNILRMHKLLKCLSKTIDQEETKDPGRRRRQHMHVTDLRVINGKEGMEEVEALCFDLKNHHHIVTKTDFESMPNIRFLKLDYASMTGDFANVFPKLRWLRWQGCLSDFKATEFSLTELEILDLSWSKVTKDWGGWRLIKMELLKVLNLTGCTDLLISPTFSSFPNLEILILERCSRLVHLDPSVGGLKRLLCLNLKSCTELNRLPAELAALKALEELLIDETSLRGIPLGGDSKELETLSASYCLSLSLPDGVGKLVKLRRLSLRNCHWIQKLPESIGQAGTPLEELDISGTGISELPDSFCNLQRLRVSKMDYCLISKFPSFIWHLDSLEEIHASSCRNLEGEIPEDIRQLISLRILRLPYSAISWIPPEIKHLSKLETVDVLHCDMLSKLPALLPSGLVNMRI